MGDDEKNPEWPPPYSPEPDRFETVTEAQNGKAKKAIRGSGKGSFKVRDKGSFKIRDEK